jgi:hypothetical protein
MRLVSAVWVGTPHTICGPDNAHTTHDLNEVCSFRLRCFNFWGGRARCMARNIIVWMRSIWHRLLVCVSLDPRCNAGRSIVDEGSIATGRSARETNAFEASRSSTDAMNISSRNHYGEGGCCIGSIVYSKQGGGNRSHLVSASRQRRSIHIDNCLLSTCLTLSPP